MDPVGTAQERGRRLLYRTRRIEGASPSSFLRDGEGEIRGFWARGDRWVAHRGEVVALPVPAGPGAPDRFREIEDGFRALVRSLETQGGLREEIGEDPLRIYGGFAFGDDHLPDRFWISFPASLFVLPEVELVQGSGAPLLRVRGLAREGEEEGEVARLEAKLDQVAAGLARAPGGGEIRGETDASPAPGAPVEVRVSTRDRRGWERAVEGVLEEIRKRKVSKVVLARTLEVEPRERLDPVSVVLNLRRENPGTHVFLFEPRPGSVLVGAAPETVATVSDGRFRATAVAGSIARGRSPEEQEALAWQLLESRKDREEHAYAVEDMVGRLTPLAREVTADAEPHVLTLSRIQHLETRIQARLPRGRSVLEVLEALHPTPAVCGHPREEALALLRREEIFERGWYAGPVGWADIAGDGVFAPALRCAVARGGTWRLFAGAGIVAGSDPELEWEETGLKFRPVLRALEASGARGALPDAEEGQGRPDGTGRSEGPGSRAQ